MADLKDREMRSIECLLGMDTGYVLKFSNKTFAAWFDDEFSCDIYSDKYEFKGGSKAKRLRAFMELESGHLVSRVLQRLYEVAEEDGDLESTPAKHVPRFQGVVERLRLSNAPVAADALVETATRLDLDTVRRHMTRALDAADSDPEGALTGASSGLESVLRSIIVELGHDLPKKKDIQSLYGVVRDLLHLSPKGADAHVVDDDVSRILGGLMTVVHGIGALRTHGGDAHGREKSYRRIDARIARLAVNTAHTVSLFLIETWRNRFPR
ncbi:MAG: abortive infection family protein [Myxococcota bacterium]